MRAAAVLARDSSALIACLLWSFSVRVEELAVVMTDLAVNGGSEQVVMNNEIVQRGRELLTKQKQ
jgi:hypothetical protein